MLNSFIEHQFIKRNTEGNFLVKHSTIANLGKKRKNGGIYI